MSRMYLRRSTHEGPDDRGPLAGVARAPFWTRDGVPVLFAEALVEAASEDLRSHFEPAAPGTFGRSMRQGQGECFYLVDSEGEAREVPRPGGPSRLYGFGRRGVAVHLPGREIADGFAPVELLESREEVQGVIDRVGSDSLHVIEYEVVGTA